MTNTEPDSTMGPRDTSLWAKEMILHAIDQYFLTEGLPKDFDERHQILRHRSRVAKYLGFENLPNPLKNEVR